MKRTLRSVEMREELETEGSLQSTWTDLEPSPSFFFVLEIVIPVIFISKLDRTSFSKSNPRLN